MMRKALRTWVGKAFFRLALPAAIASNLVTIWLRKFRMQMYLHRRHEVVRRLAEPAFEAQPFGQQKISDARLVAERICQVVR